MSDEHYDTKLPPLLMWLGSENKQPSVDRPPLDHRPKAFSPPQKDISIASIKARYGVSANYVFYLQLLEKHFSRTESKNASSVATKLQQRLLAMAKTHPNATENEVRAAYQGFLDAVIDKPNELKRFVTEESHSKHTKK